MQHAERCIVVETIKFFRAEILRIVQNRWLTGIDIKSMDKLSTLIGRFTFNARVFFNGDFCDTNQFQQDGAAGHLHLVRQGPVVFEHAHGELLRVDEPSMVFYPRGAAHRLSVPDDATAQTSGALVLLEVSPATATELTQAAVAGPLSVTWR